MNIFDWLNGWRRHKSVYVETAISRRGAEGVKTYINGTTLMLRYKTRRVVFAATHWYTDETYDEYIQKHVDIVLGLREDYIL